MDPRADHAPALPHVPQRRRDEVADRREDDHGVELLGRPGERVAGPHRAERACELLRLVVTRARAGEDAAPLCDRDLADDVRRGAEAVQAERFAVAGEPERPVADEAGAEQRRCLRVRVRGGNGEAEPLVRDASSA